MPGRIHRPLRVLIAGAGVAGLEALLALRSLAEERVAIELLAPAAEFAYRPLAVAEPFGVGEARRFDVATVAGLAGARFRGGSLTAVDPDRRIVRTSHGQPLLAYDVLLLATGARPREAVPGALTFWGSRDADSLRDVLQACRDGRVKRLVFAVAGRATWPLPLYELALLTGAHLAAHSSADLTVVTPEDEPLELFGPAAGTAIRELFDRRGIGLVTGSYPASVEDGQLRLVPGGRLGADCVVTLPRLSGPRIAGLRQTDDGFVRVDAFGRAEGVPDVFAAGDVTDFPIKQGGIAAQQADAAAQTIAALAGAPIEPEPFRPVLRGMLLTGAVPHYLASKVDGGHGETSQATADPLWWPPAKIFGRYLAPFLAAHIGLAVPSEPPSGPDAIPVDVDLEASRPAA